jgi:integrase
LQHHLIPLISLRVLISHGLRPFLPLHCPYKTIPQLAGKIRYLLYVDGRYYARRVVPAELRKILGKRELQEPLGADRRKALEQLPVALVRINAKFDHARAVMAAGEEQLSAERFVKSAPLPPAELAAVHYQERLALDLAYRQAGPSWASIGIDDVYVRDLRLTLAGRLSNAEIDRLIGDVLDRYRRRGNVVATPGSAEWREIAQVVAGAELEALERSVERDEGADPATQSHPPHLAPRKIEMDPTFEPKEHVSLRGLLEDHLRALEREGRGRAGRKAWPRIFDDLVEFLANHRGLKGNARRLADDAHRLTGVELTIWRDKKLETLASKTVKDVWMAAVKAALGRAVEDHKLEDNPAAKVKVRSAPRTVIRPKGYTDSEAAAVLRAARHYAPTDRDNPQTMESTHIASAKRWGPWLCAFTGARIGEIMQIRKSEVLQEGEIHFVRLTPEAGSVKSRIFRDVPLHPQLIEEGFLKFVAQSVEEPLFYAADADLEKRPAQVSSGRVSTWLKEAKLTPDGVQPNHAWRHRFKTTSRDLGLDPRVVEAIQGHAGRTAADNYGEVSLKAKAAAIAKLPPYEVWIGVEEGPR